jgi:uncharacterized membrane protein
MLSTTQPVALAHDLRNGSSPYLRARRRIAGLSLFSSAILGVVALYQIGIVKRLPQPPGKAFDTKKVNGSVQAYSMASVPDAFLGLASYSATACLAALGPSNRAQTHPWMPLAMGAKLTLDAAMAVKLTATECTQIRAFSIFSLLAAAATLVALPLAFSEVKAAVRS